MNEEQRIDPQTLQASPAIKDAKQAFEIYKNLVTASKNRIEKSSRITKKIDGEQPFSASELRANNASWRRNYNTGFITSHIKRVFPFYLQVIDAARVLTSSKLSIDGPAADQKNDTFAVEFTNTLRRWSGWVNFKHLMTFENLVYGFTSIAHPDLYEWRPTFLRGDQCFFPDGASQDPEENEVWAMLEKCKIHKLAQKLRDPQAFSAAGWNIENIVKAINSAKSKSTSSDQSTREDADANYESNLGSSYASAVPEINLGHVFAKEIAGGVSHWIINADTGDEIYVFPNKFESMSKCLSLMTIEVGNGKLYGSKGIGRMIYNIHVAADQTRNAMADSLYLSGMVLVRSTQKGKKKASISVSHPMAILDEDFEIVDVKFNINAEAFFSYDRHLNLLAELLVGAYMPGSSYSIEKPGEKPSAAQTALQASIESVIKDGTLGRFWSQFMSVIYNIQRTMLQPSVIKAASDIFAKETATGVRAIAQKVFDFLSSIGRAITQYMPITQTDYQSLDKDAVDCALRMLRQGLTEDEIYELAQCPPQEVSGDLSKIIPGVWDSIYAIYAGNPNINQPTLITNHLSNKVGFKVTNELVNPQEDNTLVAEGIRMQTIELGSLLLGEQVPVSPRDKDEVHMDVIRSKADVLIKSALGSATQESIGMLANILSHYEAHLSSAKAKGSGGEKYMEYFNWMQSAKGLMTRIEKEMVKNQIPQAPQLPEGVQPAL